MGPRSGPPAPPKHTADPSEVWDAAHVYLPPWRDSLPDGTTSAWAYGPRDAIALARETAEYRASTGGGGLWDPDEEGRMHPRACDAITTTERFDHAKVRRFVRHHSHELSTRLLEVYALYYESRWSRGRVARELRISKRTVDRHIEILRERVRAGRSR